MRKFLKKKIEDFLVVLANNSSLKAKAEKLVHKSAQWLKIWM